MITKLGQPVKVYNKLKGVVLGMTPNGLFKVSTGDKGVNWVDELPIEEIEIWK